MQNMQQREKILAIVLAGVVVVWFGLPMIESTFFEPIRQLENEEARLQEQVEELFNQRKALALKDKQIGDWRLKSLPPNPLDAQRLYNEWLSHLAMLSGLEPTAQAQLGARTAVGDTYVTIPVTHKYRATLQDLALFLDRFESADLLHRIAECNVVSPAPEGNPKLEITILAEGISLQSATPRSRLFPQTELERDISREAREAKVTTSIGFPEAAPFRVRVGNELLTVTEVNGGTWKIERGAAHTFAERHAAGATVELFPVKPADDGRGRNVELVWNQSVFAKPAPPVQYNPRLATTALPVAIRGQRWSHRLEVQSWNPAFGSPRYELISGPAGLRLDERSGQMSWTVERDAEAGRQRIETFVRGQAGNETGFRASLSLTVRDPNQPPTFEEIPPLRFYLGRESRITVKASDPDNPNERFRFALENAPDGMTIDSTTGEIRWTPPETLQPAEIPLTIKVTDSDSMPETATARVTVSLFEDSAQFTYLIASLARSAGTDENAPQEKEAWIYDRATNRRYVVKEGEKVKIADIEMTVKQIASDHIIVERFGDLYRLDFELPLAKMKPLAQAGLVPERN